MDKLNQFHTGGRGYQVLLLLTYIIPLEQCLYDSSTGRRTPDAVLFQCIAQFVIIYQFTGCFHRTQQGGFGIRAGRLCPFLIQVGDVWATFALHKRREYVLILTSLFIFLFLRLCRRRTEYDAPARI